MRACDDSFVSDKETMYVKTDTIYKEIHDTITKKVKVKSVSYVPFEKAVYKDIDTCNSKMNELLKEYNKKTVYNDTVKLDSLGTITVIDTVFNNKLKKRIYIKDYK